MTLANPPLALQHASRRATTPSHAAVLPPLLPSNKFRLLQVCEHLMPLGKAVGVRVVPVVGGLAPAKQLRLLSKRPAVVVATPGRLWELMCSGEPHLADMSQLSFLVLDEADRMVQAGHFQVCSSSCSLSTKQPLKMRALAVDVCCGLAHLSRGMPRMPCTRLAMRSLRYWHLS